MNKKVMLLSAAAIGTFALTLTAVLSSNKIGFLTKATESPYAIADDEYEVAFLEQYNDVNAIETEDYSYGNDRPLGNNTIPGHIYGGVGPNTNKLKQTQYETTLLNGIGENSLVWRFSGLNVKAKSAPYRLFAQLENNSSTWNICNETSFPQETCPDEYAVGQLIKAKGFAKGAVMFSKTAIQSVDDFSFFWRSSYAQKVYVVYKIANEEWKILDEEGNPNGNYTGTRGWDAHGFTTFNFENWENHELYGKTAQIGLACTEAPTESGSMPITAVLVNANKAAVRYLNTLTYKDNICKSNGENLFYDLHNSVEEKTHNQDLFHLATERATGEFLANYSLSGTKTTETSALGLYNHLVGAIPALGDAK